MKKLLLLLLVIYATPASAQLTAAPKQTAPGDPKQTAPGDPKQTAPGDPKQTAPGDPKQTKAAAHVGATYQSAVSRLSAIRATALAVADRGLVVERGFDDLTKFWLGTRWGLGAPQTDRPGTGKINCGTFVGLILAHLGLNIEVKKLQRQPAELIIKTFVRDDSIIRFRNAPVDEFIDQVAAAGDGVYIVGLDFHVGFLRVKDGVVRFVHASYVTQTVVDELARTAEPIVESRYRVVGKLFGTELLDAWAAGDPIQVRGHW